MKQNQETQMNCRTPTNHAGLGRLFTGLHTTQNEAFYQKQWL